MTRRAPDATRHPEAERAFLAGCLELLTDDPARCREAVQLVDANTFTIEAGDALHAAIEAAADLTSPSLADVLRLARERGGDDAAEERALVAELSRASVRNRGGYALAVERHATEINKAASRRRTIEAAAVVTAVAADPAAEQAEIAAAACGVAEASSTIPTDRLGWQPFPIDLLPDPVDAFVAEAAERLSTDATLVAFPMLASIAATIGNRRRIELWAGWQEPPIFWMAGVAAPGSMKSPAADKALQFIRKRQRDAFVTHREAMTQYEADKRDYDRASRRRGVDAGEPPIRPTAERVLVDDVTIEALGPILQDNPNGLLVARDELSGWFDFDRYSAGKGGGEVGRWLSCYSAGPLTVDRKLSGTVYVPAAAIGIVGTIQPKTLARVIGSRHIDNGLLQRFMLASPPRRMKEVPAGDVDFAVTEAMRWTFERLSEFHPMADGSPVVLDLDPGAQETWNTFYREQAAEQFSADGPVGEMLSKAEAWAARLALVVHAIRQAGAEPDLPDRIDTHSIRCGIGLARWAAHEWRRVYDGMARGMIEADDRALRDWLRGRGGVATARDVQRHGPAAYRAPGAAEAALQRLARAGAAEWQTVPTGGRPADAVRLR